MPIVHAQVPINIAAAENDSPVRALVPARKVRAAFVCFEVYHFYAIHNAMMSPLVGCLSLLGIHLEKKKKKNYSIMLYFLHKYVFVFTTNRNSLELCPLEIDSESNFDCAFEAIGDREIFD